MNAEGGTLVIGVTDEGKVVGLDADYKTLGKSNRDGYELFLTQLFQTNLSGIAPTLAKIHFESIDGLDVCRIEVATSARAVFARSAEGKELSEFFVRIGNSTRHLVGTEMTEYQETHWA